MVLITLLVNEDWPNSDRQKVRGRLERNGGEEVVNCLSIQGEVGGETRWRGEEK